MNKDLFEWIVKVIDGCTLAVHLEGVDRLIDLYYEKEKNDDSKLDLQLLRRAKYNEIHNILE